VRQDAKSDNAHLRLSYIPLFLEHPECASLRQLQSQTGEELDTLLPSVLDKAFKGEL
jgi:hypothetical protein